MQATRKHVGMQTQRAGELKCSIFGLIARDSGRLPAH